MNPIDLHQALMLAFALLQVADVVTTLYALRLGAQEGNKVLARIFGVVPPGIFLTVYKAGLMWAVLHYQMTTEWLASFCGLFMLVLHNNLRVIRKQRRRKEGA